MTSPHRLAGVLVLLVPGCLGAGFFQQCTVVRPGGDLVLEVVVRWADGGAAADACVQGQTIDASEVSFGGRTNADGIARFQVPPRHWRIQVHVPLPGDPDCARTNETLVNVSESMAVALSLSDGRTSCATPRR